MPADTSPTPAPTPGPENYTPPVPPAKPNFEAFTLIIYNQVGVVYSGEAKALACANNKGEFSILPGHTNFISLVTEPITIYLKDNSTKKFDVGLGVLRVLNNQIEVYTGLLVDKQTQELAAGLSAGEKPKRGLGLLHLGRGSSDSSSSVSSVDIGNGSILNRGVGSPSTGFR